MNVKNFITSNDYQEFKQFMLNEFVTKPLDIKATDIEGIAVEVKACQIAIDKLVKGLKKFELTAKPDIQVEKPYR
jgi:hypothetical protein